MKKLLYKTGMFLLSIAPMIVYAQQDSATAKFKLKFGAFYNSHLNYYGRTDSLKSSGFFPIAELWWNNKFYVNVAPVFTSNPVESFKYAGTVATAGYLNTRQKSSLHIYLIKPIYKDNSQLVQSALKAQFAISHIWRNKFINLTTGADIKLSSNTDYGATIGLDHIFRKKIAGNIMIIVDPSLHLYAGTQQFSQVRYEKNGFLIFPGLEQQVTEKIKKFSILSYEVSLPVIFNKDKWMLLLTPAYVIPQNLFRSDQIVAEKGKGMVYITAGAKLSL